jgi:hypothetical protein
MVEAFTMQGQSRADYTFGATKDLQWALSLPSNSFEVWGGWHFFTSKFDTCLETFKISGGSRKTQISALQLVSVFVVQKVIDWQMSPC